MLLIGLGLLLLVYILVVRWRLVRRVNERDLLPDDLPEAAHGVEAWLRLRDMQDAPLQPGCESSVSWAQTPGMVTDICILNLHGWGASPLELSPVQMHIARCLGANLLTFRNTAHGLRPMERGGEALVNEQSHMQLRRDAAVAHALARRLGTRVVILGCSTGASLALWLSAQSWVRGNAALVLLSPGFRLKLHPIAWAIASWLVVLLPRAGSRALLTLVNGGPLKTPQAALKPGKHGEAQMRCWTRVYPIEAVRSVIELYVLVGLTVPLEHIRVPVLALGHPGDKTVSFEATRRAIARMPRATLRLVDGADNHHIISGRIASPGTIDFVVREVLAFLERECGAVASVPQEPFDEEWDTVK